MADSRLKEIDEQVEREYAVYREKTKDLSAAEHLASEMLVALFALRFAPILAEMSNEAREITWNQMKLILDNALVWKQKEAH